MLFLVNLLSSPRIILHAHADVPPLEDMSEYLNKLGFSAPSKPSVVEESVQESSSDPPKQHVCNSGSSSLTDVQASQSTKGAGSAKKSSESAVFGGFRKGFLLSAPTSKSLSSGAAKPRNKCPTEPDSSVKESGSAAKNDEQLPVSLKAAKSSSAKEKTKRADKEGEDVPLLTAQTEAAKSSSAKKKTKRADKEGEDVPLLTAQTEAAKSSSAKKKTKRADKRASGEDVPLLTAQPEAAKKDDLVIDEVQDAMKKGTQHLMKDTGTVIILVMSERLCVMCWHMVYHYSSCVFVATVCPSVRPSVRTYN